MDDNSWPYINGFLAAELIWVKYGIWRGGARSDRTGALQVRLFCVCLWEQHFIVPWIWDRASAQQDPDPVPWEEHPLEGEKKNLYGIFSFFSLILIILLSEARLWVLRAGMMRPNRGFILLLLNGTACLVRKELVCARSHTSVFTHLPPIALLFPMHGAHGKKKQQKKHRGCYRSILNEKNFPAC